MEPSMRKPRQESGQPHAGPDPRKAKFRVDLTKGASHQLDFLKAVSEEQALQNPVVLSQALQRYEHFWLPLAAKHAESKPLVAPLDIEWIWHCHLLAPLAYQHDCTNAVGKIVDHQLVSLKDREASLKHTRSLWHKDYKDEPFELDLTGFREEGAVGSGTAADVSGGNTRISYDSISAALRQKMFFYQVSLPHFRSFKFLSFAKDRYTKFLYLKQQNPSLFIVPCYDIDLIWHTHMLHPLLYQAEMEAMLGKTFPHDDSVNDRSNGSKLNSSQMQTQRLWRQTFKENFNMFGAMFRGDPPEGKLYEVKDAQYTAMATKVCNLRFENLYLRHVPNSKGGKLMLKFSTTANRKLKSTFARISVDELSYHTAEVSSFNTREVNGVRVEVVERKGFAWFKSETVLEATEVDVIPMIDAAITNSGGAQQRDASMTLPMGEDNVVSFAVKASHCKLGLTVLALMTSDFQQAVMPPNVESMWGPVPFNALPPDTDDRCVAASHRMVDHTGAVMFTCRVIHSVALLQSVVHIYYHDKMAAVAHLVGPDTLPLPTQVENPKKAVFLNPVAGERAVLIKNNSGDWAFVVGRWKGYSKAVPGVKGVPGVAGKRDKRGIPGKKGVPGKPGCAGTLLIRVWKCGEVGWKTIEMPYLKNKFSFSLDGLTVNLKNGSCEVAAGSGEVAEKLALAFSVSLLHVLCQPRPKAWTPGQTLRPSPTCTRGRNQASYVPSEDMSFTNATGFLLNTPSNHYIHRSTCGSGILLGPEETPAGLECNVLDGLGGEWSEGGVSSEDRSGVTEGGGECSSVREGGDAGRCEWCRGLAGCGGCGGCGSCGGCGGCGGD